MNTPLLAAILVASLAATALAQPMPPQRKADLACEQKVIEKLGAPAAAKLVDGTRQHQKNQYSACFSARRSGGDYRFVLAMCDYNDAGEVIGAIQILDDAVARDVCGKRFSRN